MKRYLKFLNESNNSDTIEYMGIGGEIIEVDIEDLHIYGNSVYDKKRKKEIIYFMSKKYINVTKLFDKDSAYKMWNYLKSNSFEIDDINSLYTDVDKIDLYYKIDPKCVKPYYINCQNKNYSNNYQILFNFNFLEIILYNSNLEGDIIIPENYKLTELDLSNNKIKKLDISNLHNLETIKCSRNEIESIKFPKKLKKIDCHHNNLKSIDLTNFNKLESVEFSSNPIDEIILPKSLIFKSLILSNTNISHVDVSNTPNLETLILSNSKIKSIDFIKKLNKLETLFIENNDLPSNKIKEIKDYCDKKNIYLKN